MAKSSGELWNRMTRKFERWCEVTLFPLVQDITYNSGSHIAAGPTGEICVFSGDFTETETFDFLSGSFLSAAMNAAKITVAKSTDAGAMWPIRSQVLV